MANALSRVVSLAPAAFSDAAFEVATEIGADDCVALVYRRA